MEKNLLPLLIVYIFVAFPFVFLFDCVFFCLFVCLFVCFLLLVHHLYMVSRDEKKYGHQFMYNSLLSCMDFDDERQCLHVLYSSLGDLDELVALGSGYKQLGITLAFYSNGIEFLTITLTKNFTLSCIVRVFGDGIKGIHAYGQFSHKELAAINVTFTFVLAR